MRFLRSLSARVIVWLNHNRQQHARTAYAQALDASRKAWKRGDTRTIHSARKALVQAQAERLRIGA